MNVDEAIVALCEIIRRQGQADFKEFEPIRKLKGGYWVISSKGDKLYNVNEYGICDCPAGYHRGKCRHADKVAPHTPFGQLMERLPCSLSQALTLVSGDMLQQLSEDHIISIVSGTVDRTENNK